MYTCSTWLKPILYTLIGEVEAATSKRPPFSYCTRSHFESLVLSTRSHLTLRLLVAFYARRIRACCDGEWTDELLAQAEPQMLIRYDRYQ